MLSKYVRKWRFKWSGDVSSLKSQKILRKKWIFLSQYSIINGICFSFQTLIADQTKLQTQPSDWTRAFTRCVSWPNYWECSALIIITHMKCFSPGIDPCICWWIYYVRSVKEYVLCISVVLSVFTCQAYI